MSDRFGRCVVYVSLSVMAAGGLLLSPPSASAAGCNGHVEPQTWGCAPWDNNNGPKFPHYKAPAHHAPVHHAAPAAPALRAPPPPVHHASPSHPGHHQAPTAQLPGQRPQGNGLIGDAGSTMRPKGNGAVSQGAGNILGNSSSGVISQGGGNFIGHDLTNGASKLRP
jgi:hypothetical protein